MDFYRNADKWGNRFEGVSYNQVTQVTKAPVEDEPLTLSEVKEWCKIDGTSEDAILTALIIAAREICEQYTCVSFVQREFSCWLNNYNGSTYLPYGPIRSVDAVYDENLNEVDFTLRTTDNGFAQINTPRMILKVEYIGGYEAEKGDNELPEALRTALKAQVLYLYENRGDAQDPISPIAAAILNQFKRV